MDSIAMELRSPTPTTSMPPNTVKIEREASSSAWKQLRTLSPVDAFISNEVLQRRMFGSAFSAIVSTSTSPILSSNASEVVSLLAPDSNVLSAAFLNRYYDQSILSLLAGLELELAMGNAVRMSQRSAFPIIKPIKAKFSRPTRFSRGLIQKSRILGRCGGGGELQPLKAPPKLPRVVPGQLAGMKATRGNAEK